MRICIVVPYDLKEQVGVNRHAMELARVLREMGDQVVVVGPDSTDEVRPGVVGFGGIANIQNNDSDNHLALFTPPWKIRSLFRKECFDVIHVMEPLAPMLSVWSVLLSRESAKVVTFHAFTERESLGSRIGRALIGRAVLRNVDRAIAVSRPAERFARVQWKDRELAIIPNGVDVAAFRGVLDEPIYRPIRLLFVGSWRDKRKGLNVLLESFQRVRCCGHPVTLDVVGTGVEGNHQIDGVTFHGHVSESRLVQHYRECDVFVAPSLGCESFGMVLLEAMAAARPIICSSIEGYRQVASASNALLVPPGDVGALEHAIAELVREPQLRRSLAEDGQRHAAMYDWTEITRRVRQEYILAIAMRFGESRADVHRQPAVEIAAPRIAAAAAG